MKLKRLKKIEEVLWIARFWIIFGVMLSCLPPVLTWAFWFVIGCDFTILDMLPDCLSLSFAVAVNAYDCARAYNGEHGIKRKFLGKTISGLIMFICFAFYFGLYAPEKNTDFNNLLTSTNSKPILLFIIVIICLISTTLIGISIKWAEHIDTQKKNYNKQEKNISR